MYLEDKLNNKVAVIGGGSFGTALATLAASDGREVVMYVREEEIIKAISDISIRSCQLFWTACEIQRCSLRSRVQAVFLLKNQRGSGSMLRRLSWNSGKA